MEAILSNISFQLSESTFLKNPESSDLGQKIIKGSIDLIYSLGFEQFTFRKLADHIQSTEASIYRYFESKHKVLLYLTNWYWLWMEYRLVFIITNIDSPKKKLSLAIELITEDITEDNRISFIDERKLHKIVLVEASKSYLTKTVDEENKDGAFLPYKNLVERISNIVKELNPNYKYPHMLISTVIEGTHLQRHFAEHLPRLTDQLKGEDSIAKFYHQMVFKTINRS